MRKRWNASIADLKLYVLLARFCLIAILTVGCGKTAVSQPRAAGDPAPASGAIGSLPDALLIYPAQGAPGTCGENCAHWLAVEGTVHWDGHKRILAGLDRFADRKR